MKLTSFSYRNKDRIGVAADGGILDIADLLAAAGGQPDEPWTHGMIALIEAGEPALGKIRNAVAWADAHPGKVAPIPAEDVKWYPPVRRPTKICCLALNNSANANRIVSGPKHPAIFIKAANALIGHNESIEVKQHFGRVHPEPELAIVVGKTAKNIEAAQAFEYVFGYTIHNDITSPTMRGEDTFNYRAIHPSRNGGDEIEYVDSYVSYSGRYKGTDTFSPMGPWLVTKDDIVDPHTLRVTCSHQGNVVTEDNTENLFHRVPEVMAFVSGYITLVPGDIISMGTALKRAGPGGRAVQNVDLMKLGGPVSVTIDKIGTLSSHVARV